MPTIVIPDLDEALVRVLERRASRHGHTPEAEAKQILSEALRPSAAKGWEAVNALHQQLASSGRNFSDSTELLREDRER